LEHSPVSVRDTHTKALLKGTAASRAKSTAAAVPFLFVRILWVILNKYFLTITETI